MSHERIFRIAHTWPSDQSPHPNGQLDFEQEAVRQTKHVAAAGLSALAPASLPGIAA
jgi:hypothetical protein